MQQRAQILCAHAVAFTISILEQQHAILGALIEGAVANKVQDMIVDAPQLLLQGGERRRDALQYHQATLDQLAKSRLQLGPLALHVEWWMAARTGDHGQQAQWRCDRQLPYTCG